MDKLKGVLTAEKTLTGNLKSTGTLNGKIATIPRYEHDYEKLINRPQIEGVELIGNKTFEELNLDRITNSEIENMLL